MKKHKCSKCGETNKDKFGVDKSNKSGLSTWCKECWKKHRKNRPKKQKEIDNERHYKAKLDRRAELRLKILEYLKTNPCVICGESDPIVLCFDHIDPKTKVANVSVLVSRHTRKWETVYKEIKKCRVLCANCHTRETAKQQGWYQKVLKPKKVPTQEERVRMGYHKKSSSKGSSKYKGVSFHKKDSKWWSTIIVNKKQIYLGRYDEEKDAAKAYNKAALKYFGEHAYLNKV